MKGKIRSITAFLLVFALLIMYLPAIAIATDGVATLKDVGGNLAGIVINKGPTTNVKGEQK